MDKKNYIKSIFNGIINFSTGFLRKIYFTVFSCLLITGGFAGVQYYNEEGIWYLTPILIPLGILGFSLFLIKGLTSIKDNVDDVCKSLLEVKEFKNISIKEDIKKISLTGLIRHIKNILTAYTSLKNIKETPQNVLDSLQAIKSTMLIFNPVGLVFIISSILSIWVYNIVLLFLII